MRNIRIGIIGALVILSFLALPAKAQTEDARLANVQVDVWPDYDQPAVLVLVTAVLPSDGELPAMVSLNIPSLAGEPSAVAVIDENEGMFTTEYTSQTDGDMTNVTLQASETRVRIEYYYPYTRSGNRVSFDYQWPGGMAVDELVILFREPAGATAVQTGDNFVDIGLQADGQRYHQWSAGSAEKGDVRSAAFSYTMSGSETAISGGQNEQTDLYPILFAGGGLIVGGLVGWFLANRRTNKIKRPVVTRTRKPASSRPAAYCHQCGARIKGGDAFCRQCGEKVA
ncbi:MAG: zinc ribbon domain-containing protein [Anaerolineales bacterium]|nr:zinc ribbon domain-containing protein [Anaerolineales bacterium]